MPSAKEKRETMGSSSLLDETARIYNSARLYDEESLLPGLTDTPEKFNQKMAFLHACDRYIEQWKKEHGIPEG